MKKETLAHLALLTVNLLYGINFLVAKEVMPLYIGPSGFIFVRVVVTATLFMALYLIFSREKIEWKDAPRLLLCALTGVAANQLLFYEGLNRTSPINAAVIFTANPILTLPVAMLLMKEIPTTKKIIGALMGAAGAIALILFSRGSIQLGSDAFVGNLCIFLSATSYAVYLVIAKPLMAKYKPITVISLNFLVGLFFVSPFGWGEFKAIEWSSFPTEIWTGVVFTVIGTTFIAYLFSVYALKFLKPVSVSVYIYIQPVTAAILALFFGKDVLTIELIACSVFIFAGVYLVLR